MATVLLGGGAAPTAYQIVNSVRFNGTSDYLSKALTTSATTSGAVWVKRAKLGAVSPIFDNKVYFTSGDALHAFGLTSSALYRDPSAWYHVFWNGTGVYINGTPVTGTGSYAATSVTNPRLGYDGTNYFSGYLSDFAFWDGSSASLQGGATNTDGVWAAKRPSAGYSFLDCGSSGALGTDTSGNGNNWTVSGSPVQTTDTPTNNHSVWNAVAPLGGATLSAGNTTVLTATAANSVMSTVPVSSGKWYCEYLFNSASSLGYGSFGVAKTSFASATNWVGSTADSWSYYYDGHTYNNNSATAYGSTFAVGDRIGIAIDLDSGKLWFSKNGTWQNSGDPYAGTNPAYTGLSGSFVFAVGSAGGGTWTNATANFGATAFTYTPPTGFKALNTTNLPAVSIKKSSDHFNTALAAGASIKTSSEALYTYFLEWIKDRANSNNHQLIDTVRGSSAVLQSNTTAAETTYSAPSGTSVGWVWNAAGAAMSNTSGSITSSVSANATAGMSVVTWSHTSGVASNFGHGLGPVDNKDSQSGSNVIQDSGWGRRPAMDGETGTSG